MGIPASEIFSLSQQSLVVWVFKPEERCTIEYANSNKMTAEMVEKVKDQNALYNPEVRILENTWKDLNMLIKCM